METSDKVKQIIVIRKDLKTERGERIRRGKEISQGAHASMAWITSLIRDGDYATSDDEPDTHWMRIPLTMAEIMWCRGLFTKVTCQVANEAELREIHAKALVAGLKSYLIEDSGLTEFGGVKTATAVGIGPDYASKIDLVCRSLSLY